MDHGDTHSKDPWLYMLHFDIIQPPYTTMQIRSIISYYGIWQHTVEPHFGIIQPPYTTMNISYELMTTKDDKSQRIASTFSWCVLCRGALGRRNVAWGTTMYCVGGFGEDECGLGDPPYTVYYSATIS